MNTRPHSDDTVKTHWIRTQANLCDHPILDYGAYDRRSAWLWIISNATWKRKTINHKGRPLELQRGQLLAGRAFLAQKWGWTEQKVRTFLSLLHSEDMVKINQSGGHYANVLTICNYDKYQKISEVDSQSDNQSVTRGQPERNQTLTKSTKIPVVESPNGDSSETLPLIVEQETCNRDVEVKAAVAAWNDTAAKAGLPKVRILSSDRRKKLLARLKDAGGLDGWKEALARLAASDFLTGKVKSWKADFGFVLQQESFAKLVEGSYDNRATPNQPSSSPNAVKPYKPSPEEIAAAERGLQMSMDNDRRRRERILTIGPRLNQH